MSSKNKKPHVEYEFMGPLGVTSTIISLPLLIYAFVFFCYDSQHGCLAVYPSLYIPAIPQLDFGGGTGGVKLVSREGFAAVFGWFFFQALLYIVLPGPVHEGVPLVESGKRLKYVCNGFRAFIVSMATVIGACASGYLSPSFLYHHYLECATAGIVLAVLLSVFLYVKSMMNRQTNLSPGGNTGNLVYDFFIGRQLNPRIGDMFDLKFFCELRPGLIGWTLINFSMAAHQYETLGTVTISMLMVIVFQFIYVFDALWNEPAILTTMDITQDGFGFMLAFGDLAWVPFTYSIQARYLALFPVHLSTVHVVGVLAVKLLGFYIFRASNGQKNDFRSNPLAPNVSHLKTLKTEAGTQLLISGWWGMARHINYFGDWLMGLAWCLPCGFTHIIPYWYALYFAILLIHRESRDEDKCIRKYGKDWTKYCSIVKYRIVPYIY